LLGRFLEVSVHAPDVAASLAYYESLGFVQAVVGDAWSYPYAVVTDGRLHLGLHGEPIESPTLTWVRPDLAARAPELAALGIEPDVVRLGEDDFHEIGFHDPAGQALRLVEARTFSASRLGYFEEFGVPTPDLERSAAFWEALGLVAFDPVRKPFPKVVAASRDLNLGLYDVDLRAPVLAFSDAAMPDRIAELRAKGFRFVERLPRGLNRESHALLEAPEGTWLLLTTGSE
jgi:catechol 2,3-dioxygenase-like lactoylglutathione lyase family enzyme